MANLQLAVNGEYFDAMQRGEKVEEYRLVNPYWGNRIFGRDYDSSSSPADTQSAMTYPAASTSPTMATKSKPLLISTLA